MDKTVIKNYAVAARRKLIEAVRQKAYQLYIFEDGALPPDEAYHKLRSDGIFMTPEQSRARERLCAYLALLGNELDNEKAYQHLMEEVAYTWFNRLIALRFMEVNDYLPSGIRILSSVDKGRAEPDAMREAERLPYVNQDKIAEYRAATGIDASEKLYKYILISQCNALSDILPGMFEKIDDYTELLLPDAMYQKGGIVHDLVHSISEDDFCDQVQIIGWLYQYYISEKKDEVFAGLKKNIKINKETIPAATQLFTPEWIVKYMVENSLGRLFVEKLHLNPAAMGWRYYVPEAEQTGEVQTQLALIRKDDKDFHIEQVKLIDPCMGSGHILVYAFDVLYQIYFNQGYAEREIPNLILQNNLYGLDIDGRAAQLAYFALMMKARSYNRRFFRQESIPQPHVHAVIESDGAQQHHLDYMGHGMNEVERQSCKDGLAWLISLFADAREYGSILKIDRTLDYDRLRRFVKDAPFGQLDIYSVGIDQTERILLEILSIAEIMTQKYDVVVTNPPYMSSSGMGAKLSEYVKKEYPDSKSDMSTVFMERTLDLCSPNGYMSMINIPVWMFLTSYEKLRSSILTCNTFINLLHFGRGVFGADFGTTAFVLRKDHMKNYIGLYRKLYTRQGTVDSLEKKQEMFFSEVGKYATCQDNFQIIPGMPMAYSASTNLLLVFSNGKRIDSFAEPKVGLQTGDNSKFLRLWFEVNRTKVGFSCKSRDEAQGSGKTWFPYNKGGGYNKWYGNNEYLVNWENDGHEIRNFSDNNGYIRSRAQNTQYYFRNCLSWCKVTISGFSMRYIPYGFLFDVAGCSLFLAKEKMNYVHGYANSKVNALILSIISPTVNYEVGHIASLPVIIADNHKVEKLVDENISISRINWDSFETSWDFRMHPLVETMMAGACAWSDAEPIRRISSAFKAWELFTESQFNQLKANEEELNRIFIEIYGLQDELTPGVEDKDVTIRKADLSRDIRSFISYAVGCMFGRYSLDEPGLVFAGGRFNMARYKTFLPEDDNILPIGASDYFDDDIVVRFVGFVRVVYGDATLDENLNFIADALYPNGGGSSKEKIRRYFLNDFYKDHVKTYQKRPMYWLFESGKKDGFKALIYLHRYDKFTVARVRTDYLHPLQRKYESEIGRLEMLSGITENAREKAAYRKEIESLQSKIEECRVYDQVVAHIAHQAIELDLDDGVKVNYAKFQGVEVPKDNGKTVKMDLLAKI